MFIGFGKFTKYHKYILFAIICQFISDYSLGLNKMNKDTENISIIFRFKAKLERHKLVKAFIEFLGFIFGGVILYLIYNKLEGKTGKTNSMAKLQRKREKYLENKKNYNFIELFIIGLFLSFNKIIVNLANSFLVLENDFWMLELISITIFSYLILKMKIKNHHKAAIIIIILVFFIDIISNLTPSSHNDDCEEEECKDLYITDNNLLEIIKIINEKLKNKYIIIVIIFILFFLGIILKDYSLVRSKYLIDIRGINPYKILISTGLIGCILVTICSFILSSVPCYTLDVDNYNNISYTMDNMTHNISNEICFYTEKDKNNSNKPLALSLYYDNITKFFNEEFDLTNSKEDNLEIFLFIPLYFIMYTAIKIINVMMIKYLDPNVILINKNFTFFVEGIISYFFIIQFDESYLTLTKFLLLEIKHFISIIANLIYLEILELKFCNLDYDIRKSIALRSEIESESQIEILGEKDNDNINDSNIDLNELSYDDLTSK